MSRPKSIVLATAAIGLIAASLTLGPASHFNEAAAQNGGGVNVNLNEAIFPSVQIIEFDGSVARFDTTNGSIYRFAGDLSGSDARGNWRLVARPLTQSTSHFLQIQQASNGFFLIDAETGDTWILRKRGSVASWIEIPIL